MNSSSNLKTSITKEKKKKGEAKSALASLKAEPADEVVELRGQIDDLKRRLDATSDVAKESKSVECRTEAEDTTGHQTVENVDNVAGSENAFVDLLIGSSSTND